jgi:hypothetical protein
MLVKETDRWMGPSYFRQESQLPTGKITAYTDGKSGWIATPRGAGPLAGAQLKQVQGDLFRLYFRLLNSDRIPGRSVNAIDEHTLEISDDQGQAVKVIFNERTGLPEKVQYEVVQAAGAPITVEDDFSDFRDYAGLKIPFHIEILQGGQKFAAVTVTDVKMNSGFKLEELEKRP